MSTTQNEITPSQERADATRARVVQAARELVVERGYSDVSTTQVLERADVSRGGLYHHFSGMDELMGAVLEAVERDFTERLGAALADVTDPFDALTTGTQWYLDECMRSTELQRVGLYEGRAVLGWLAWREVIAPYGLSILAEGLATAIDDGQIAPADPTVLAHLILAALHEAATIILTAPDPATERARTGAALAALIEGLRRSPS